MHSEQGALSRRSFLAGTATLAAGRALLGLIGSCGTGQTFAPWTFAYAADIQVGSPRSFRFKPAWNDN